MTKKQTSDSDETIMEQRQQEKTKKELTVETKTQERD